MNEQFICEYSGRNCDRKLDKLNSEAEATNTYTAELLDDFAIRQRGLVSETTVRIKHMADAAGVDVTELEIPEATQESYERVEFKIAEHSATRPVLAVKCAGVRLFGRCGAYITVE